MPRTWRKASSVTAVGCRNAPPASAHSPWRAARQVRHPQAPDVAAAAVDAAVLRTPAKEHANSSSYETSQLPTSNSQADLVWALGVGGWELILEHPLFPPPPQPHNLGQTR